MAVNAYIMASDKKESSLLNPIKKVFRPEIVIRESA
jgi:hypothetical protein